MLLQSNIYFNNLLSFRIFLKNNNEALIFGKIAFKLFLGDNISEAEQNFKKFSPCIQNHFETFGILFNLHKIPFDICIIMEIP